MCVYGWMDGWVDGCMYVSMIMIMYNNDSLRVQWYAFYFAVEKNKYIAGHL